MQQNIRQEFEGEAGTGTNNMNPVNVDARGSTGVEGNSPGTVQGPPDSGCGAKDERESARPRAGEAVCPGCSGERALKWRGYVHKVGVGGGARWRGSDHISQGFQRNWL